MRRWSLRCWETKSNIRPPRGPWSPKYVWEKIYQRSGTFKSIENWRSVRRRGPWKQRERCVGHRSAIGQPGPRIRTWGLQVPFRRKLYNKTNETQFINEFTVVLKQAYTQRCVFERDAPGGGSEAGVCRRGLSVAHCFAFQQLPFLFWYI